MLKLLVICLSKVHFSFWFLPFHIILLLKYLLKFVLFRKKLVTRWTLITPYPVLFLHKKCKEQKLEVFLWHYMTIHRTWYWVQQKPNFENSIGSSSTFRFYFTTCSLLATKKLLEKRKKYLVQGENKYLYWILNN